MPTLTIRNVDVEVHQALRMRAAANGRSMEAEVRAMLQAAAGLEEDADKSASTAAPSTTFSIRDEWS